MAIEHAQRVLGWQENLGQDEMPPQWLWVVEDELETWFEDVDRKRKEKYGSPAEDTEESEMMSNTLARGKR